ncbi:neuronal acetylcholine receptor subunit alpha-7-like [Mytilus trossulus]|uniref:neuronal acetylcholine receptor subunit alpha-7-like n=1 Tax=Mytilus trossulus TaxID=6551 RepID=UPI0030057B80
MKEQILTTSGIRMSWRDEFLTWNRSFYGETTKISAPLSEIWNPDVHLINYADRSNIFEDKDTLVNIYSTGLVEWHNFIELKTYCFVDTTQYPFETEICKLHFSAQYLDEKEQLLKIQLQDDYFNQFQSNGEWHISKPDKIRTYTEIRNSNSKRFAGVVLEIEMERRQTYYVWKFLVPTVAITCINMVTFLLPVKSGAKVTLSTFVVLSFTVMIQLFNQSLPSSSDKISQFGRLLWCLLGMSGLSLIFNVVITAIFYRKCTICKINCSVCNFAKLIKNFQDKPRNTTCCCKSKEDEQITELKYIRTQEKETVQQGSSMENKSMFSLNAQFREVTITIVLTLITRLSATMARCLPIISLKRVSINGK